MATLDLWSRNFQSSVSQVSTSTRVVDASHYIMKSRVQLFDPTPTIVELLK